MTMLSIVKLLTAVFDGEPYPTGLRNPFGDSLFLALRQILTVAAILAAVYCGAQLVMSNDERIISRARIWLGAILMAVVLAYALPAIIKQIAGGMSY